MVDFGAAHIITDYEFFSGLNDLGRGQPDAALERFERAVEVGHGIKEVYNNIGSALAEHDREGWATRYFETAVGLDPRYTLPRWNLFRISKKHARWQEARDHLSEIIKAAPEGFRAYGEMGFLLRSHFGDTQGAVHFWQESLRLNPAQPQITRALAECDSG